MTYYQKKYSKTFTPKKPVHTFRDLEVYQKTIECSVIIVKSLKPGLVKLKYDFVENFTNCCMSIPLYIGEAHSVRFADFAAGIAGLEKAMAACNKMVIYLEQIKGIYGSKVDGELIDDIIGRYAESRGKIFRLEKSWKRFREDNPKGENQNTNFRY